MPQFTLVFGDNSNTNLNINTYRHGTLESTTTISTCVLSSTVQNFGIIICGNQLSIYNLSGSTLVGSYSHPVLSVISYCSVSNQGVAGVEIDLDSVNTSLVNTSCVITSSSCAAPPTKPKRLLIQLYVVISIIGAIALAGGSFMVYYIYKLLHKTPAKTQYL
jgi:hypothetical protein